MDITPARRCCTLVARELQEYKLSLVVTPLVIAAVISLLMLGSVLLANRITAMGDDFLKVILSENSAVPIITINISDDSVDGDESTGSDGVPPSLNVEIVEEPVDEEEWNFSREWRFEPQKRDKKTFETVDAGSLNPVLNVMHGLMSVILAIVTINYLLGSLFTDRKDRSILFWRSLPVSEWEEVLVRFAVAMVVAPAIYTVVSLALQMMFVASAMLMAWRMNMDPFGTILGNLEFGLLLQQQIGGWLLTALWVAPVYAWLMLASAWAKRSPFLAAAAPVLALAVLEALTLGSDYVASSIKNHVPHFIGGDRAVGFYFHRDFWLQIDYLSLIAGLIFAAAALAAAVYLRRYRFEI